MIMWGGETVVEFHNFLMVAEGKVLLLAMEVNIHIYSFLSLFL
jgi:hypothetical protein